MNVCADAGGGWVLLYHLSSFPLETELLTEPGTRLMASRACKLCLLLWQPRPASYTGAGDLNPVPHVCAANTLVHRAISLTGLDEFEDVT